MDPGLAERLRSRRESLGLGRRDLGFDMYKIRRFEQGKQSPTVEELYQLAHALHCAPLDLLAPPRRVRGRSRSAA